MAMSAPVIEQVRKLARDAGRIVLLANADGIIVSRHADCPIGEDILREGFAIGTILHEQRAGTNGIGTSIASRQAITVHAEAHFNEAFRAFTCAAAPVFAPDGSILAAIDISGRLTNPGSESSFAMHFIREAAATMSLMLFRKQHMNDCIITLSPDRDSIPHATRALVATDETGRILGATGDAYGYLGSADLQSLSGRSLADYCDAPISGLRPAGSHHLRFHSQNGMPVYATAFLPRTASTSTKRSGKAPPSTVSVKPLDYIAGHDATVLAIIKTCRKIIDCDLPILLLGETGSGKDTLARAIHAESSRATKPYVAVNCAAIPATLLASELFGYAPGTFSGGIKSGKTGKIAASHGGTLFLDEIGDMPLDLQAHLLRVLEDRAVTPLGATISQPVDMKIICATHRDLRDLVSAGQFRQDLYYRIRGAQFTTPALRQRSDLEHLATAILAEEWQSQSASPPALSPEVLAVIRRYDWPGNIRELRSVIRYIAALHGGAGTIRVTHLPETLCAVACGGVQVALSGSAWTSPPASGAARPALAPSGDPQTLRDVNFAAERDRILEALTHNNGCIAASAHALGISRTTLHRKMRDHAITASKARVNAQSQKITA